MSKSVLAMVLFIVGAVLGIVAAIVPEAAGRLTPLAVACLGLGLAVQAAG
jgi:hypothetical protein